MYPAKYVSNPVALTVILSFIFVLAIVFLTILYLALRPKTHSRRITEIYLSGEGEDVVSSHTPSPMNMYWTIIKKFFNQIYRELIEKMHTGSLLDWASFMLSWFGLLIILSIAITLLVTVFAVLIR
ncbi:MAG: sodium:proton antiporter [Desulfurococcaceae archaeon]